MTPDWFPIALALALAVAFGVLFFVGACWVAGEADEREAELSRQRRQEADFQALWGDQHPHRDNF